MSKKTPPFLKDLLDARSPSGAEYEAQAVVDKHLKPAADTYQKDTIGNRIATLNPKGDPVLMLAGHMDEIGFIASYVNEKGFIYFEGIGGHDLTIISGRRVSILTAKGDVQGVTGKRAVHLMDPEDRKKAPKKHELWIDIGAKNKAAALKRISIGDPIVYADGLQSLHGSLITSRAFDDKAGCYAVCETLRRLSTLKKGLAAKVVSVATAQEEVGVRGAEVSSFGVKPHIGIAVDVGHATDHPDCDPRKHKETLLGGGPILARGPNVNPFVFDRLVQVAKKEKIPYQVCAEGRPTGTDARAMQMAGAGIATGVISIPLRYMHTPSEVIDLDDLEHVVGLLVGFAKSLKKGEHGLW